MKPRSALSRFLLFPVGKSYSGRNFFKALKYKRLLEKTQYFEPLLLETLRNEQFRNLIAHCYNNVPFYRQFMDNNNLTPDDFRTFRDITKLPILSKKIVNENRNALTASNYNKKSIRYESTGGTTGTPTRFGRDKRNEYRVDANNWRFWEYAGYVQGMKVALFWGNRSDLAKRASLRQKLKHLMENSTMFNFFDFSEHRLLEYVHYIKRYRPDIIRGYSGAIYLFVAYCKKKDITFANKPKAIILTSEKIYQTQKEKIQQFFECEVFEEYGSREFSIMAHECEVHHGLHLAEELFIFEVVDPFSNKYGFQGKGEIVVTPFFNYAMPLLRYRIGDEGEISSKICSCGRTLKLLSNIEGRIADYIITKREKFIDQGFFSLLLDSRNGILRYQVQQYEKGRATIYIVKSNNFSAQEMDKIKAEFKNIYEDDLIVSFKYVDQIEVPPSGKTRALISHIAAQYLPVYYSEQ